MALQQKVIQKFMGVLNNTVNSNPTKLLDDAVLACHSRYHTIQEVIDECLQQRVASSSADEFLKKRCGIDLDNEDTGALLGVDACGGTQKTAISIIPETDISNWKMPESQEEIYGVLKVIYPDLTNLNSDSEFIVGCLHTWWIPRALHLIASSYGFEFNSPDATPKEITVRFSDEGSGVLAYVQVLSDMVTGKVTQLELVINTDLYVYMDTNNPNGVSTVYSDVPYLDRTIAHEFVHAVQATNIDFFQNLGNTYLWFVEGSAELVHGIDDERKSNILDIMANQNRFAQAFTQNPVDVEDVYSAGYILLRYLARQVANGYTQHYRIKRHLMTEKGNVKSLKAVGEKFIEFAQRSNNGVQAWERPHYFNAYKRLDSFYGETLKVPMRNHADIMAEDKYYLLTSSIMENTSDDIDFIDVLKAQYQKINFNEDYLMTDLDDVLYVVNNLNSDEQSHIIFSGCELEIANGQSIPTILEKLKNVVQAIKSISNSKPSLVLTPTADMFIGNELREDYKRFLNTSSISRKLTMVCIGDSITDPNVWANNISWTTYCQEALPDLHIINKGIDGDDTAGALARFSTDVIEQSADICFLLIGGNDMWYANSQGMATAKANLQTMVDLCISNNIVPILASYMPTIEQVTKFIDVSSLPLPATQVHQNFKEYRTYCKELARNNDLLYVDDIYRVVRSRRADTVNKDYVVQDLIHLTVEGKKIVGDYITSCIKDFIYTEQNKLYQDYDIINLYDVFCKHLNVDELTKDIFDTLVDTSGYYKELDWITEYIFSEGLLRPFNCPCFYVSLEHMNVDRDTYKNWLRTSYSVGNQYKHTTAQWNWSDVDIFYQSEKYNHTSNVNDASLFKNDGEFIAIGLHTLFDGELWMCEQGGITCEKEAYEQVVDMNWVVKNQRVDAKALPVFPGTGCPWLTLSEDNKADFNVEIHGIDYWFTKSDYDATITIRVSNGNEADAYQSISLGLMTGVNDDSYLFPLYVAGGTEGIAEDIYVYGSPYPTYRVGNMYDLNIKRISMSNSNLLSPTKFNKANVSNFKILTPSGVWRDIFVYQQDVQVIPHPTCNTPSTNFYVVLKEVENISESCDSIIEGCRNKVDIYSVYKQLNTYEHSSVFDNIIVNIQSESQWGECGCLGVLPNCYSSWYRTLDVGEVTIDNRRYLSIPNGWDNRLWYYPRKIGMFPQVREDWEAVAMQKYWDEYFSFIASKRMTHRLLIPLEEGD